MTERNWSDPLDFKEEGIEIDYKLAGVDIDAGNDFVNQIKPQVKSTHDLWPMSGLYMWFNFFYKIITSIDIDTC